MLSETRRPLVFPSWSLVLAGIAGFLALGLMGCGAISFDEDDPPGTTLRRLYVNDKAANDSLSAPFLRSGVKFVLQPGKTYDLTVMTDRTADFVDLFSLVDGTLKKVAAVPGAGDGVLQTFSLQSNLPTAEVFVARMQPPPTGRPLVGQVALNTPGSTLADVLPIRLIMIRSLRGLPDAAAKQAFAAEFFRQMGDILSPYGITVQGSVEIVEGDLKAVIFPFNSNFVGLPGTRVANHAHFYLVDSISDGNQAVPGEILGFSPREVLDIDFHPESRVVLANRATAQRLAITATHELGHFFGLRHTVSTSHDINQDKDLSNIEDGFQDTRFCIIDLAPLPKRSAAPLPGVPESPYCLRTAGNPCNDPACDLDNLMHPVECPPLDQTRLSPEQVVFLKKNLALYLH